MRSGSNLEKLLLAGQFCVYGRIGSSRGSNASKVREKARYLKGIVDAVNITDNQTAVVRMSSWGASSSPFRKGWSPNYQNGLQGPQPHRNSERCPGCLCQRHPEICSAFPETIRNFGDHPDAMGVFDIDSMQLIQHGERPCGMRGSSQTETPIDQPPRMFIGAALQSFCRILSNSESAPGEKNPRGC